VRLGLALPSVGLAHDRELLLPVARAAEQAGLDSLWATDHILIPADRRSTYPYGHSGTEVALSPGFQWLEPITTLGVVAGATERIGLGTSVLVLPYRNPVVLAAQLASLDVLAGPDRLVLGVGVGWMTEEFDAVGVPRAERGARTDEHIAVLRHLWAGQERAFEGAFTRFDAATIATQPATPGGPPILVGGNSDAALRRAARLGDGWHGFDVPPEDMPATAARLARHAEAAGRDAAALELSVVRGFVPPGLEQDSFLRRRSLGGSADEVVDELGRYAQGGVDLVVLQVPLIPPQVVEAVGWLEAEVLPRL
jgi:probable F420-dependent oxidoreductase